MSRVTLTDAVDCAPLANVATTRTVAVAELTWEKTTESPETTKLPDVPPDPAKSRLDPYVPLDPAAETVNFVGTSDNPE